MNWMPGIFVIPLRDVVRGAVDPLLLKSERSIAALFAPLIAAVAATWFVTVPLHELLHAAGCLLSGGTVNELMLQPLYGGRIFERFIPFVHAGGDYAGRLSGFDTGGSDFGYFVTVLFPYILTLLLGFPMLARARKTGNPLPHAVGIVHTLLPLVSLPGDYYELGSIVATRIAGFAPGSEEARLIRGDDLVHVLGSVAGSDIPGGFIVVGAGVLLALLFIWSTWWCSLAIARIFGRKALENREG